MMIDPTGGATFLSRPWPWYMAGPLIGLLVPVLLVLGNRGFGVSSALRHLCAALLPGGVPFFRYDWQREGGWNLAFVAGIVVGVPGEERRVGGQHLSEAACGEAGLGGNVEGLLGEAARGRQLHGEAQGKEELRLAGAALASELGDAAEGHAAAERGVEVVVKGADGFARDVARRHLALRRRWQLLLLHCRVCIGLTPAILRSGVSPSVTPLLLLLAVTNIPRVLLGGVVIVSVQPHEQRLRDKVVDQRRLDGGDEALEVQQRELRLLGDVGGVQGKELGGGECVLLDGREEGGEGRGAEGREDAQQVRHGGWERDGTARGPREEGVVWCADCYRISKWTRELTMSGCVM